ncbi:MAG: phosphoribosylamine--glycine ligase [Cytophagaceae bacterium]
MNIVIVGSGGRENTLAWKIRQSPKCDKLFVAPGNAGTEKIATNINIPVNDFPQLGKFCIENSIDMVVVGPEAPLVEGIKDYFKGNGELQHIVIIGPDKKGAQLEGSKDFSKSFMQKYGIPTAASKTFTPESIEAGLKYIENHSLPIVLKADGLAAGKGVIIAEDKQTANETLKDMLVANKFGSAGSKVVIEEYLSGIELSVFVITDGKNYLILPEAKDYKRIGEGDTGPNTGGMGAISPVPFAGKTFMEKVEEKVIKPTITGLNKEGITYTGFIFFGLMNVKGEPSVIEYNARLGDPETEVIIPRLQNDIVEIFEAMDKNELDKINVSFDPRYATTVMMVAGGYPGNYEKGKEISGLEKPEDVLVFHAGTKSGKDGKVYTDGGRVLTVTAFGTEMQDALNKANKAAEVINWQEKYYRRDIGFDLLSLEVAK